MKKLFKDALAAKKYRSFFSSIRGKRTEKGQAKGVGQILEKSRLKCEVGMNRLFPERKIGQ